jgi:hypothetical protein
MIIKKQEKDNKIKVIYESSNILASIFDVINNDLTIIFKAGTQYIYPNVSKSDYLRFEMADSQGSVFNTHIKKYSNQKLDSIDPTTILNEIKKTKENDKNVLIDAILKTLVKDFKTIIQFSNTSTELNNSILEIYRSNLLKIKLNIDKFFETTKTVI